MIPNHPLATFLITSFLLPQPALAFSTPSATGAHARYTYDEEDRLLRVEQGFDALTFSPLGLPAERFRFTYDLFGRRMTTDHNGELTRHIYRLDGPLPLLLYEQTATDPRIHLWACSTLLAEGTPNPATWSWPLFDALGTTTETVNPAGALRYPSDQAWRRQLG